MTDKVEEATQTMIRNLEANTGKSLDAWIAIVNASGTDKVKERINFLKAEHGLTYGYANLIALYAKDRAGQAAGGETDMVAAQYAGEKAGLWPMYESLIATITAFGSDVVISPKRTYVSLRRDKQFALIQPTTKSRLDIGLNLKAVEPQGKLEAAGSFNAMCTHRVRLEDPSGINAELIGWLKAAYEAA